MPRYTAKATVTQEVLMPGDVISGKLWINPGSLLGRQAAGLEISSICVAAKCRARAEWQESTEIKRKSELCVYRVETQLLTQPVELTGPKVLDFKLTLPVAAQRTASSWNPSRIFEHAAGHEIPPSLANVVEHSLEIQLKSEGRFFRSPLQTLEVPYRFVTTRLRHSPPPDMMIESKHVTCRLPEQRQNNKFMVNGRVKGSNAPDEDTEQPKERTTGTYYVTAGLPGKIYIGGSLPIGLTVRSGRSVPAFPQETFLRRLRINIISISGLRVKLAENTRGIDPEKSNRVKARHCLKNFTNVSLKVHDGMRLDEAIEGLLVIAPEDVPTFKTYNVARSYVLEIWMCISIGDTEHNLQFTRDVTIESGYCRPPAEMTEEAIDSNAVDDEDDESYLPAYEGRPPSYTANVENRVSLTAQAAAQGVDIIDLL